MRRRDGTARGDEESSVVSRQSSAVSRTSHEGHAAEWRQRVRARLLWRHAHRLALSYGILYHITVDEGGREHTAAQGHGVALRCLCCPCCPYSNPSTRRRETTTWTRQARWSFRPGLLCSSLMLWRRTWTWTWMGPGFGKHGGLSAWAFCGGWGEGSLCMDARLWMRCGAMRCDTPQTL
jgi:hypothetical protein